MIPCISQGYLRVAFFRNQNSLHTSLLRVRNLKLFLMNENNNNNNHKKKIGFTDKNLWEWVYDVEICLPNAEV